MPLPWSRRAFLLSTSGSALALSPLAGGLVQPQPAYAADEFGRLRDRWRGLLLGSGFSPTAEPFKTRLAALGAEAGRLRDSMVLTPGSLWPDADFADPAPDKDQESFGYSARVVTSCTRLLTMAQAYCRPGTGLTKDAGLRDAVVRGLDHLYARVYHERQKPFGNWWSWQIGAPQALLDTCVLMYEDLSTAQRAAFCRAVDHFVPVSAVTDPVTSTGANRVDMCRVLALRGVVGGDGDLIAAARDALSPAFPLVRSGDGLYADGSFLQHTYVPYSGTYGSVLLGGLGKLFALLTGSAWQVTDPQRQVILDAVENAWAPVLYNGLVMDGVSGRAISRGLMAGADPAVPAVQQDDHQRGHAILAAILTLGQGASAAENTRWRALVKGWAQRDRYSPPLGDPSLSIAALADLKAVLDDPAVKALPEPVGHRLFPGMARATHRRPGWAASLSMADKRITHYETGNGENLRGWHTGSGMLYWWGDSYANGQYSDAFWPTVDPYRLPGTTVSRKPLADAAGGEWGASRPDVNWVGGASDGTYASVGQYLKGLSSTLMAKKSWFFLDDAVVCLGAGIQAKDGAAVETTVDNRNLGPTGAAALTVDGVGRPTAFPWSATVDASWAHLAGHGGYVFPGGAKVRITREKRTGRWSDINKGGATTELTRAYLTLTQEHGVDPYAKTYAYVLLPGASAERTAAYAKDTGRLTVLANTEAQQGIQTPALGLTAVNFWLGASVGPLEASGPCAVLVRELGDGTAVVCVSDPMRTAKGLTLVWRRAVGTVLAKPGTVQRAETGPALTLEFGDLSGTAGATQTVRVRLLG